MYGKKNFECKLRDSENITKSIEELVQKIDTRDEILLTSLKNFEDTKLDDASREDLLYLCHGFIALNQLRESLISNLFDYIMEIV